MQQHGDKGIYGSDICFAEDGSTGADRRQYNSVGTYATTQYEFTDKAKRNPVKVVLTAADLDMHAGLAFGLK